MVKVKKELLVFFQNNFSKITFFLFLLTLPVQLGKHFWPPFAFILGLRIDYLSPTLFLNDLFAILFIASYLKQIDFSFLKSNKIKLIILGITTFLIINTLFSKSFFDSFYALVKLFEFTFLGLALFNFFRKEEHKRLLFYGLASGILMESIIGIWQFIIQGSIGGFFYFLGERNFTASTPGIANASLNGELFLRSYSTFPHPNVFAAFLFISMALIIFVVKDLLKTDKIMVFLILGLGIIALFLTLSRLGIILFLIFAIIYLFFSLENKKLKLLVFITFFAFLAWIFLKTDLFYRFTAFQEEDIAQRAQLLNISWEMFRINPILGVGIGNFLPSIPKFASNFNNILLIQPVHNIFALMGAETGVVGLLGVICLCFYVLISLFKQRKYFLLLLCLEITFWGNFDHFFLTLQQGQLLLTLVLTYIFANIN